MQKTTSTRAGEDCEKAIEEKNKLQTIIKIKAFLPDQTTNRVQ